MRAKRKKKFFPFSTFFKITIFLGLFSFFDYIPEYAWPVKTEVKNNFCCAWHILPESCAFPEGRQENAAMHAFCF